MTEESAPPQDMNMVQPEVNPNPDELVQPTAFEDQQGEPAPVEVQTDGDSQTGLVEDVDKAWDMAHAAKEERDEAVDLRKEARETKALIDSSEETDKEKRKLERFAQRREESANDHDEAADEIEEWAAILHDHPVSEAYRESHPGIDFDAATMAYMVGSAERDLENTDKLEQALEAAAPMTGISGLGDEFVPFTRNKMNMGDLSPLKVMRDAYGTDPDIVASRGGESTYQPSEENRAAWAEYKAIQDNPDTTLGQLKDVYIKAFKKAHIDTQRSYAHSAMSVIEDVRSGRASE